MDRSSFDREVAAGGFLEWAEFLGHLYGTPRPRPPAGSDVLLEIDLQGARQVVREFPEATVVLLLAPSEAEEAARMRRRGDPPEQVARRLDKAREEVAGGRELAAAEVVNDDLDQAVAQVAAIIAAVRSARTEPAHTDQ